MPPWSELGPDELTALPSLMRMEYSLDGCPSTAALFLRRSSTTGPRAHPERLHGGTDGPVGMASSQQLSAIDRGKPSAAGRAFRRNQVGGPTPGTVAHRRRRRTGLHRG